MAGQRRRAQTVGCDIAGARRREMFTFEVGERRDSTVGCVRKMRGNSRLNLNSSSPLLWGEEGEGPDARTENGGFGRSGKN